MDLTTVLTSIAENLHRERLRAGLTLDQLAQRADLSVPHLSRLESGDRQPSIAALVMLSRALAVPVSALLGEDRNEAAIGFHPGGNGTREINGLTVAAFSGFPGSSALEALRITLDVGRIPPAFARHRGEEWIYVLSGRLLLEYEEEIHVVEPGCSAHFDAERPHRLGADGSSTEVLVVAAAAAAERSRRQLFQAHDIAH